ncbi:MAG: hypothetical protein FWF15_11495 [Oscillospiraceae bacterium]|nr:hypothetical protein [Oscillospiraceae bacterium]
MTSQLTAIKKEPISFEKSAYWFTLGFILLSMLYLLFKGFDSLSMIQCIFGVIAIHIPKLIRVKLPDTLCIAFYLFIICAIPLGEVFSFYYRFPIWDSVLHYASGIMLYMVGSLILVNYLQKKNFAGLINPVSISVFSVMFAISLGVFWEFYEFAVDSLFATNMQKFLLEDGTALVGQAALVDTIKDLLVGTFGAISAALIFLKQFKNNSKIIECYNLKHKINFERN